MTTKDGRCSNVADSREGNAQPAPSSTTGRCHQKRHIALAMKSRTWRSYLSFLVAVLVLSRCVQLVEMTDRKGGRRERRVITCINNKGYRPVMTHLLPCLPMRTA